MTLPFFTVVDMLKKGPEVMVSFATLPWPEIVFAVEGILFLLQATLKCPTKAHFSHLALKALHFCSLTSLEALAPCPGLAHQ